MIDGYRTNRRELLRAGLQAGAALGIAGLGGLTFVSAETTAAQGTMPTTAPIIPGADNVPEWTPSPTARSERRYRWEQLAEGQQAESSGVTLHTIGLGVTVQDRFFNEFQRRSGHQVVGKVTTLTDMINEWLAGGAKNYDCIETNASRNPAIYQAGLVWDVPAATVVPWKYARDTFTSDKALGYYPPDGWPLKVIWKDVADQSTFMIVPQTYNCDSVAYRPDLVGADIDTWGALLDPTYKGKVGILNDSILTLGWAGGYLAKSNTIPIKDHANMTHEEVDQVVDYLIKKKQDGQFRVIWDDYGQCVNLMASGECWLTDGWNPVVEDVKKQGVACKYATPKEGFTAWFHGISVRKDTANVEAVLDYINFCLEGWWGAEVATQGYYSPTTCCDAYLKERHTTSQEYSDYQWWYQGGASPGPKAGWPVDGRDTGSYDTRWKNIMHWESWPDDPDYYAKRWNDFLSA
jgi:spermidine/putrescine-binding protein